MTRVLVAGVSTRAAAESAAAAGFAVTAIDAFGDLDQHPSVRVVSLASGFTPRAAARAAQAVECDAVVYLANFENHPDAIGALAEGRALWGNTADAVRRVRNPAASRTRFSDTDSRSLKSGSPQTPRAGHRLRTGSSNRSPRAAASEFESGSATNRCRADVICRSSSTASPARSCSWPPGGDAVPLGVSRQLVGDAAFGASGIQYLREHPCGCRRQTVFTARRPSSTPRPHWRVRWPGVRSRRSQRRRLHRSRRHPVRDRSQPALVRLDGARRTRCMVCRFWALTRRPARRGAARVRSGSGTQPDWSDSERRLCSRGGTSSSATPGRGLRITTTCATFPIPATKFPPAGRFARCLRPATTLPPATTRSSIAPGTYMRSSTHGTLEVVRSSTRSGRPAVAVRHLSLPSCFFFC